MAGSNATTRGVPRRLLQGDGPSVPVLSAGQIPTIQYSSGNARALMEFSRSMFNLSAGFEDQLDREAEAEATTQGALAGVSGDIQLRSYGTIRGRAYNKAAIETFAARIDTQSAVKLQELQGKYWNDPGKLQQEWDNWRAGFRDELSAVSPEQAAAFDNRAIIRGLPAIEQAKDTAYKLTRSEADAALVENEAALRAEIKAQSADLFSENPERSSAAARAINQVGNDYMRIFNAVDATTGKPLYSPEEKAAAKKAFRDTIMTNATLSWFDEQPDKAGAYLKITSGDFKFKLNLGNGYQGRLPAGMRNNNPGNIKYVGQANAIGPSENTDQGDPQAVYATAEDGMAAMLQLLRKKYDGGKITPNKMIAGNGGWTPGNYQAAANVARHAGIGPDDDINLNDPDAAFRFVRGLMLQEHGKASSLYTDDMVRNAIKGVKLESPVLGTDLRGMDRVETQEFSVLDSLSERARDAMDTEMRQRISFANSMRDREDQIARARLDKQQDNNAFELNARALAAGGTDPTTGKTIVAPTREEVIEQTRIGNLKPGDGEAILKALSVERPETSDTGVYRDLLRRMMIEGEDIGSAIIAAGDKLSAKDAENLLTKNRSVNKSADGGFNKEQDFYFDNLKMRLGQTGLMDKFDQGKQDRAAMAYDEYRRRVLDPENQETPQQISDDIAERASREVSKMDLSELSSLVPPRFSVMVPDRNRVDIDASKKALQKAYDDKLIGQAQLLREIENLKKWRDLQTRVDQYSKKETTK